MVHNDILECFILNYGLAIDGNGLGRPVMFTQLWLDAQKACGDCTQEEVLDALYNIQPDHAALVRYVRVGAGSQAVSFERVRHRPGWKAFLSVDFRIQVSPAGRLRCQKLLEQLQKELPQPIQTAPPIGFTA